MNEARVVNGVNISRLIDSVNAIKDNANLAQFTFKAINRWAGGGHCYTSIQDFTMAGKEDTSRPMPFVLQADEPTVLLGANQGPNATEALLYALASCLNTSLIFHASAQGVKIEELEIKLEGNLDVRGFLGLDESVRNGYQNIEITFKVKADASDEKIRELCELAQKRSPVFDIVSHGVPIRAKHESISVAESDKRTQAYL